jgi:hypothetical protein
VAHGWPGLGLPNLARVAARGRATACQSWRVRPASQPRGCGRAQCGEEENGARRLAATWERQRRALVGRRGAHAGRNTGGRTWAGPEKENGPGPTETEEFSIYSKEFQKEFS